MSENNAFLLFSLSVIPNCFPSLSPIIDSPDTRETSFQGETGDDLLHDIFSIESSSERISQILRKRSDQRGERAIQPDRISVFFGSRLLDSVDLISMTSETGNDPLYESKSLSFDKWIAGTIFFGLIFTLAQHFFFLVEKRGGYGASLLRLNARTVGCSKMVHR